MTAAIPKLAADVLLDEMNELILTCERHLTADDHIILEWDARINKFLNSHPAHAQITLARLCHFQGDRENAEHFLERARQRGASQETYDDNLLMLYANLLYAGKTQEVAKRSVSVAKGNVLDRFTTVALSGAFSQVALLLDQADKAGLDVNTIVQIGKLREIARSLPVSAQLDNQLAAVIDCAGEVLRSRSLFWLDRSPRFSLDRSTGCAGVRYRVATTPAEAAQMSLETAEMILQRNLVDVPLTVGFTGVKV